MKTVEPNGHKKQPAEATIEARLRELEAQIAPLTRARQRPAGLTIIAFSNDLDKLLAAFTLANGAICDGRACRHVLYFLGAGGVEA